jgi:hypothetical protein
VTISYVFPNTSDIPQRGGLDERRVLADAAGCSYVEIPADLIKNKTEITATGQNLCSFLSKESIAKLYNPTKNSPALIPYILHTEPSLGRTDGFGITAQAPLKWYDERWVADFIRMIIGISDFFGKPATKIEIHPGDRRNSFVDIVRSVRTIQKEYGDTFGETPEILLENRTGQFIADGTAISQFWDYILEKDHDLTDRFGIVLDIQQLSTVTRQNFVMEFNKIPLDCLKGFHIHQASHQPPKLGDGIPWDIVFARIAGLPQDVIINPEILHKNQVARVIMFCEEMLVKEDQKMK